MKKYKLIAEKQAEIIEEQSYGEICQDEGLLIQLKKELIALESQEVEEEKGILCKDKSIEDYALKNYGRLSGLSTAGIMMKAIEGYLEEYAQQSSKVTDEDIEKWADELDIIEALNDPFIKTEDDMSPFDWITFGAKAMRNRVIKKSN